MKKKMVYTDEPMGEIRLINDFLPSPEELALKDETVKITIKVVDDDFWQKLNQGHYFVWIWPYFTAAQ